MKYLPAIKEIITSGINIIFVVLDAIAFTIGLLNQTYALPQWMYITTLIVSFLIAAVLRLTEKNKQLEDTKVEMPLIGLYFRRNKIREGKRVDLLRIRSLWPQPLKDFKIADVRLAGGLIILKFKLDDTNILAPDEERDLIHVGGSNKYLVYPASFDPRYANSNYNMTIFFKDAQNNKYKTVFNIGKDGISIKRSKRIE